MAEAIGLLASGLSIAHLASEVTRTIIRLKDYWDQIKDAPSEIILLLREIESIGLIMCHIQDDTRNLKGMSTAGNIHLLQSLELCNEGVGHLTSLVNELGEMIFESRSRWRQNLGCVKVALKKEEIKRLKRRMKSAIQLLSLSYQCHTNAMIKLQPEIIVAGVADHIASIQTHNDCVDIAASLVEAQERSELIKPGHDAISTHYNYSASSSPWLQYVAGSLTYKQQQGQYHGKEKTSFQVKYELPGWLSQRILDCAGLQSLTGMHIHFRTYRALPYYSPFFDAVRSGNIPRVQEMLSKQEGFVTDTTLPPDHVTSREHCFYLGRTPLHLAASKSDVEMCRLLVSNGADPLVADEENLTPFHTFAGCAASNTFFQKGEDSSAKPKPKVLDTCRFLLDAGSTDLLINNITVFKEFYGPISLFKHLQRQTYPPYYELPIDTRCRIAESLTRSSWHNRTALVELALTSTNILESDAMTWRGPIVNHANYYPRARKLSWHSDRLEHILRCWLEDLHSNGVDLQQYGEREHANLGNDFKVRWICHMYECYGKENMNLHGESCHIHAAFHLTGFSYGHRPEDWRFWFSEYTDQFTGDFWNLVALQERADRSGSTVKMPGGWIYDIED
ncbi:hypothetical protein B0J14DRAFT_539955 [Halenospora varia]|nr:hypothetical protein B0J14DRAFT_539955 [Halenospora varia]